jgi:NAD(P)-dependent dehydrogenase (short-subunit alcohol dehydrogenase family)
MTGQLFDLTGRTALVTGSSRGLGHAMATGLAEAGAAIVLNGANADRLGAAAATQAASPWISWSTTPASSSAARWSNWRPPIGGG